MINYALVRIVVPRMLWFLLQGKPIELNVAIYDDHDAQIGKLMPVIAVVVLHCHIGIPLHDSPTILDVTSSHANIYPLVEEQFTISSDQTTVFHSSVCQCGEIFEGASELDVFASGRVSTMLTVNRLIYSWRKINNFFVRTAAASPTALDDYVLSHSIHWSFSERSSARTMPWRSKRGTGMETVIHSLPHCQWQMRRVVYQV